jgi:hypothetical protein
MNTQKATIAVAFFMHQNELSSRPEPSRASEAAKWRDLLVDNSNGMTN